MSRGIGVTEALRAGLPEWAVEVGTFLAFFGDLVVIVPVLGMLYLRSVWAGLDRAADSSGSNSLRSGGNSRRSGGNSRRSGGNSRRSGGNSRRSGGNSRRSGGEPLCSDRTAALIAVVFGGLALVVLLKGVFSMPRPPAELHAVPASEHGFPSGHTMAATVFWGALALWSSVASSWTKLTAAAVVVSVVGFSRLALGVHYLVDVVASVLFGGVYLAVAAWLVAGHPRRAFGLAIGIAVFATVATGASDRALLALVGTVVAAVGWYLVERPTVRGLLVRGYRRAFDSTS